jgi:cytoskeletal protein CcmA (bactofilin family)
MAIFGRGRKDDDFDNVEPEADEPDLPAKPATRPSAGGAVPSRAGAVLPIRDTRSTENRATEGYTVPESTRASDMARRLVDTPAIAHPQAQRMEPEVRKLIVGREISLQGEINSCDHLVVEGSVTANLTGCREVEIMESGVFKGSVEISEIEVRGLFEGTMNVSGRLLIRSTGRVMGTVNYGQIEIEIGGQISGEVEARPQPKHVAPIKSPAQLNGDAAPAGIL